ncbi:MAG: DUF1501 domain-containing protein [Woeseiaceae bacterium]|nr:DUF1501 domain-containing protein [Woeseiaceae bacterium]
MVNRRELLKAMGLTAFAGHVPGLAFANAPTDARLVLVVLRGAVDGLALAAPYADPDYRDVRGELALTEPGSVNCLLDLDGFFGLHPSLEGVHERFVRGEAMIVHAVASPYRARSHFDGQDLLENGGDTVGGLRDGWLNRALAPVAGDHEVAIALAQNTPLVLRGDNSVTSWAPSRLPDADASTIARLQRLYAGDAFFATRLEQALNSQEIAQGMSGSSRRRGNDARRFEEMMASAARFLVAPDGPRIAVVELGGWDTHANQGAASGALANRFAALDTGLANLRTGLGVAWKDTAVAVVTEFGRTVHVNGTRGTDHGTATAALLVGGAVAGGKVIGDWPGLGRNDLHAGRDLQPTTDLRSLFKGVLEQHLSIDAGFVEKTVFPESRGARPLENLIRG